MSADPTRSTTMRNERALGFHLTLRLVDSRPIATTPAGRRCIVRVVLTQGAPRGIVAFGAADNHLHVELLTNRAAAGAFARYVGASLRKRLDLPVPFEPARIRPLQDQQHAYHTFHYAQRQDGKHSLALDPLREATSLHDLLGLRVVAPAVLAWVRAHLPRVRREDLLQYFPPGALNHSDGAPPPIDILVQAACAAFALGDLSGRDSDVHRARLAAVHAAGSHVSSRVLSDVLGVSMRCIRTLRASTAPPEEVFAVSQQALLRANVLGHGV